MLCNKQYSKSLQEVMKFTNLPTDWRTSETLSIGANEIMLVVVYIYVKRQTYMAYILMN